MNIHKFKKSRRNNTGGSPAGAPSGKPYNKGKRSTEAKEVDRVLAATDRGERATRQERSNDTAAFENNRPNFSGKKPYEQTKKRFDNRANGGSQAPTRNERSDRNDRGGNTERNDRSFNNDRNDRGFNNDRNERGFNNDRNERGGSTERNDRGFSNDRNDRGFSNDRNDRNDRGGFRNDRNDRNDRGFNNDRRGKNGFGKSSKAAPSGARQKQSKKFKGSDIRLDQLIHSAEPAKMAAPYVPTRTFANFPINGNVKRALEIRGYVTPTEIQDKTIDAAVAGRDIIGIAQTGTGKTAAFLIPLLERYLQTNAPFSTLVIVPTRELAVQVLDEFNALTKKMRLSAIKVIGGTSLYMDSKSLRRGPDVVIGTPGRLIDLLDRGELPLEAVSALVIDEFDRMLDMGFSRDVMRLAESTSNREQTLLFSATVDESIQRFVEKLVENPFEVRITTGTTSARNVEQDVVHPIEGEDRFDTLVRMLDSPEFERVILFAETRHKVHRLAQRLCKEGVKAEAIHGDKTQAARQQALNRFKSGHSRILVATDVAARGIDVSDVSHVINYEVPRTYDSYIHRIGRTGRAGKAGVALTFID